ncbi:ATP-dependent zinc metalloprotease FtsH [Nitrosococcus wardiae]|uniref:ATP-dependent zinc metalloprotease FtsH n=1 Tax=Nitrosococcus wardiae TaxID=1814290 RepID=A0A4P7C4B9_9GAMM|nr:ATP-dependent zinc metalloprotease FtsH [Nitrosococcus wardiae]QBQ55692.1 ATP-dependent metallopeptidase FtsH/Yme1/Tma family protein [Nitrosococcus wardiae]
MSNGKQSYPPQAEPSLNWRYLLWMILVIIFLMYWLGSANRQAAAEITYTEFKQVLRQGQIAEVTLEGQQISGAYTEAYKNAQEEGEGKGVKKFSTTRPPFEDPELMDLLEQQGVTVRAESQKTSLWAQAIIGMLPWLLILGLIFYASYRMQQRMMGGGGRGGPFGFGKAPVKRFREGSTGITFEDVAGVENAKRDLHEIVDYLKDPRRFEEVGAKIPKGILLMGPPGTGKTLLAKAVAGEAGVPFYSISGSDFIEMFVGVGAARVRDMFKAAKEEAPSILFIDEIDSVGRARGTGLGGGHDEREQTLNQILGEMDGFAAQENVVVLAATNRPDVLDPALLRPGRFDRKVILELPDKKARQKVLEVHAKEVPLAEDVDLEVIAKRTVGFSGADLANLVNEAALLTARERKRKVDMDMLNLARDKIVLGAERETILSEEEKKLVAYHESGHALMAWLLPEADPLDKVTIIPHGMALGATEQVPEEERHNLKRSYLLDRLGVMLGGRVAEKTIFGDVTSGAESDLKQATQLARRMVCQWGMSDKLGAAAFRRGEEHVFLGRELAQQRDFSEQTAQLIDDEIRHILDEVEKKTDNLMQKHRDKLEALAKALIETETLEANKIEKILKEVDTRGQSRGEAFATSTG